MWIVEFRIPGYPGPSNECGTEVRLMRGKIFRGKIRMYLQLYAVYNYDFLKQSNLKKWNQISSEWKFQCWKITYKWGESLLRISVVKNVWILISPGFL